MSICYFMCEGCGREYSAGDFHEVRCCYCDYKAWYRKIYWRCGLGHKNNIQDTSRCEQCLKNRREEEKRYERKSDNDNNYGQYSNNNDYVDCGCFGEDKKEEEEECNIF